MNHKSSGGKIVGTAVLCGFLSNFSANAAPSTAINYYFDAPGVAYDVSGALIFTVSGTGLTSAGTGTFGGYLTIGDNTSVIEGISSDATSAGLMPAVTASQTSAIPLSTLLATSMIVDGAAYYGFYLDLNEPDQYLSVDSLGVYYGAPPTPANLSVASTSVLSSLSTVWNMDSQGDTTLLINEGLTAGSGKGNLAVAIPQGAFAGLDPAGYIFLHMKAGEAGLTGTRNYGNAGGFEEFGLIQGNQDLSVQDLETVSAVPETGSLAGMAGIAGLCGLWQWRRNRRAA